MCMMYVNISNIAINVRHVGIRFVIDLFVTTSIPYRKYSLLGFDRLSSREDVNNGRSFDDSILCRMASLSFPSIFPRMRSSKIGNMVHSWKRWHVCNSVFQQSYLRTSDSLRTDRRNDRHLDGQTQSMTILRQPKRGKYERLTRFVLK